jgi:tRNA-specific 2-thiouridylase
MPRPPAAGTRARVKIRYHHEAADATLTPAAGGGVHVMFDAPQPAVTPGQLAVFYDGERVLGGASIEHALTAEGRAVERDEAFSELPILG